MRRGGEEGQEGGQHIKLSPDRGPCILSEDCFLKNLAFSTWDLAVSGQLLITDAWGGYSVVNERAVWLPWRDHKVSRRRLLDPTQQGRPFQFGHGLVGLDLSRPLSQDDLNPR